jgi:uncharacterized protein (TIGR02145 family)
MGAIYGKLYNWYAVNDPRGLAPTGWHVASDEEWKELVTCLGGTTIAGGKLKTIGTIEAGDGLWYRPNTGATNESGFSALPGGYRKYHEEFEFIGFMGLWWTSKEYDITGSFGSYLDYNGALIRNYNTYKVQGFSVRCVRDK